MEWRFSMNKFWKVMVPLILALLILVSIGWYLFSYDRDFTQDMLLREARVCDTNGYNSLSAFFYDLAYEFNGQDQNVAIELANQYKSTGNYTKAEYTLVNAISDGATLELYVALCNTYVEQNKILDAVNMLDTISDPAIKAQVDALRPSAPEADFEAGFYNEYISVSLSTDNGVIYYTTDGDYPSKISALFSQGISLPLGETEIRSVAINGSGLVSTLSSIRYTVGGVVERVEFADPAMEAAIRELLNTGSYADIYTDQLWEITEFTCPGEATTLSDLAYMTNLEALSFADMTLASLSDLASLSRLEVLSFDHCKLPADDLSIVASLQNLHSLTLSDCGLATISGLSGAPHLTHLDISGNTIRNLEALSSIPTLQQLHMEHNALTSLSAISGLTNLTELDVSYNSLTDISPISTCIRLQSLDVSGNQLTDLDAVSALVCLTELHADYNQLTDVAVLSDITSLIKLSISNNSIVDISALAALTGLEQFDFSYNEVTTLPQWADGSLVSVNGSYNQLKNIDVLANLPGITYIYMDYNDISSVEALADCYYLVLVNIYGNPVTDAATLTAHSIIVNYDPTAG